MNTRDEAPAFFFRRISATGFGLLRIAWGLLILCWAIAAIPDAQHFFTDQGFFPHTLGYMVYRSDFRFSLFDGDPSLRFVISMLCALGLMGTTTALGIWPRTSVIVSTLLLASFHERNILMLAGGDTVLRLLGFLLCITPELRALSVPRLREQWKYWRAKCELLPPLTMDIWPYRLLMWQVMIIYVTSAWEKALGVMWWDGSAAAAVYHHPHFGRWSKSVMDTLSMFSPIVCAYTLVFEFAWFLLFIPERALRWMIPMVPHGSLKRALLIGGVIFHLGIFVLTDVGSFSFTMFAAFLGCLLDEDFEAMRHWWNRKDKSPDAPRSIVVLFDGNCGLCLRSVFIITILDWLRRIELVNFRDAKARKTVAPDLALPDLDKAMHVILPASAKATAGGPRGKTRKGFDGFRALTRHLPLLWTIYPLLYLPGIPPIGRMIYARIADRRKKCDHESCAI